jgi:ABC-type multidrug transport system fused ATPase/permease subunit
LKALFKTFGTQYILAGLLRLAADLCFLGGPLTLKFILDWLTNPSAPAYLGWVLITVLFLGQFLGAVVFGNLYYYNVQVIGVRLRSALVSTIYKKALTLTQKARQIRSHSEIVNLMSIDAQKLGEVIVFLHFGKLLYECLCIGWTLPVMVLINLGLLFYFVGWTVSVGVGILLITIPMQIIIMRLWSKYRMMALRFADQRMSHIGEVLQGIAVISK